MDASSEKDKWHAMPIVGSDSAPLWMYASTYKTGPNGENFLPSWVKEPFIFYFTQETEIYLTLKAAILGIPKQIELAKIEMPFMEEHNHPIGFRSKRINLNALQDIDEQTEETSYQVVYVYDYAELQIKNDYPAAYSQALIAIWSAFENALITLLENWYINTPEARDVEDIKKIKVPLSEFEKMDQQDRVEFLFDELSKNKGRGISKFEALLGYFNLNGKVGPTISSNLHEMYMIRNNLAHRGGIADNKFVKDCPNLKYKIGDRVIVNAALLDKYRYNCKKYIFTVCKRIMLRLGVYEDALITGGTLTGNAIIDVLKIEKSN